MKLTAGLMLLALTLSIGCGKKDDPGVMSAEERAKYCVLNVDHETDPAKLQEIMTALEGSWQHPAEAGEDSRRTLKFDSAHSSVTLSEYFGWYNTVDSISYKKLCISTPLDASAGAFAGFRILEAMADNNEGGAALAFKLDTTDPDHPGLLVSDRYYERYSATQMKLADRSAITGKPAAKIWSYPDHRE